MNIVVKVQTADFSQADIYDALARSTKPQTVGAVVTFVGLVRDFSNADAGDTDHALHLEHYPGMTEKVLQQLAEQACKRWTIQGLHIVHRVGELQPGEQIVCVGVSAPHRGDAFAACECVMDLLKTQAPFWKKEGQHWVEAKTSDASSAERWLSIDPIEP